MGHEANRETARSGRGLFGPRHRITSGTLSSEKHRRRLTCLVPLLMPILLGGTESGPTDCGFCVRLLDTTGLELRVVEQLTNETASIFAKAGVAVTVVHESPSATSTAETQSLPRVIILPQIPAGILKELHRIGGHRRQIMACVLAPYGNTSNATILLVANLCRGRNPGWTDPAVIGAPGASFGAGSGPRAWAPGPRPQTLRHRHPQSQLDTKGSFEFRLPGTEIRSKPGTRASLSLRLPTLPGTRGGCGSHPIDPLREETLRSSPSVRMSHSSGSTRLPRLERPESGV